jgi:hypothetical protein
MITVETSSKKEERGLEEKKDREKILDETDP